MLVDCPECGAKVEGASGAEAVCPACMSPFLVPTTSRSVAVFDVQATVGAPPRRMSRYALREGIYLGQLSAATRVRHDGGPWELVGGYPEFASVFRVLGGDLAPMAGTRKLAGWGRSSPSAESSSPRIKPPVFAEFSVPVATPLPPPSAPPVAPPPEARVAEHAREVAPPLERPAPGPVRAARPRPVVTLESSGSRIYLLGAAVAALVGLGLLLR